MAQKGVDLRLPPAERDERLERRATAAAREDLAAEALAHIGIEHSRLLERAERVRESTSAHL